MAYLGVKPAGITSATEAEIAGDLTVDTNTLKVDATNNRVGVGTASPGTTLDISGAGTLARLTGTGTNVYLRLGNSTDTGGYLAYDGTDVQLWSESAKRITVDSDGLKFGSDTAAANALDDYEEGTWTPAIDFGGSSTGIVYSTQSARYTKIGRLVVVVWRIYLSNKGSASGHAHVSGFPYAANSMPTGGVFQYISNRGNLSLNDEHAYLYFSDSVSRFPLYQGDNDGTGNSTVSASEFANNTELEGFMQYTMS